MGLITHKSMRSEISITNTPNTKNAFAALKCVTNARLRVQHEGFTDRDINSTPLFSLKNSAHPRISLFQLWSAPPTDVEFVAREEPPPRKRIPSVFSDRRMQQKGVMDGTERTASSEDTKKVKRVMCR